MMNEELDQDELQLAISALCLHLFNSKSEIFEIEKGTFFVYLLKLEIKFERPLLAEISMCLRNSRIFNGVC